MVAVFFFGSCGTGLLLPGPIPLSGRGHSVERLLNRRGEFRDVLPELSLKLRVPASYRFRDWLQKSFGKRCEASWCNPADHGKLGKRRALACKTNGDHTANDRGGFASLNSASGRRSNHGLLLPMRTLERIWESFCEGRLFSEEVISAQTAAMTFNASGASWLNMPRPRLSRNLRPCSVCVPERSLRSSCVMRFSVRAMIPQSQ